MIIPARNEAGNISRCVRSVLASTYQRLEVVVVDDRSTDGTADIVAKIATEPGFGDRVRLVKGADLPEGWFGKAWALVQGFRASKGEILLFADADTRHEPELIPRAMAVLATEKVDLVSVLPRQEMVTFWERLIQPHVFLALGASVGSFERLNRTRTYWHAIANGQFILTPRKTYQAVGTHQAVKGAVAEDLALAQTYVKKDRDIFLVHGREFMTTRMYTGLREIIEGWSKNLALGAPQMMPPFPPLRRLLPWVMWVPNLAWVLPPVLWALTGEAPWAVATGISLVVWQVVYQAEGAPVWHALLYPVGALMLAFILVRSAVRGERLIEWKGRIYRNVQ